MVQLVQPLFQQAVARSFGGPQTNAPRGEGFTSGESFLDAAIGGTGGNAVLAGGVGTSPAIGAPAPTGGGLGGFLTGLASNPLFAAGITGLTGSNPLAAIQKQQQAQQQAQARQAQLAIQLRQEQLAQAKFQADRRAAREQQARAAEARDLLTGLIDNIDDPATKKTAQRIAATGEMDNLADFFSKGDETITIGGNVYNKRAMEQAAKIAGAEGVQTEDLLTDREFAQKAALRAAGATTVNVGKPLTALAKIEADEEAGRITPAQADRLKAQATDFTADQVKTAGFADAMNNAQSVMADIEATGFDASGLANAFVQNLPLGNILQSTEGQLYRAAAEEFTNAVLRRESGAAVTEDELARVFRIFVPLPGDSKPTIDAKTKRRNAKFKSFARQSGGAFDELFGGEQKSTSAQPAFNPAHAEEEAVNPTTGERIFLFEGEWRRPDGSVVSVQ